MDTLTFVFYSFAVIPLLMELFVFSHTDIFLEYLHRVKNKQTLTQNQKFCSSLSVLYSIWCFIGLFSTNWVLFLIITILGFFSTENYWFRKLDASICIIILLLIFTLKIHNINLLNLF